MKNTQWKNKTVAFLGDSITEGVGVNPGECYWNRLEESLGLIPRCYGKNGAVFLGLSEQAEEMYRECGDKLDAIVIFAGTNDYNDGVPLGEWFTKPVEQRVVVGYEEDKPLYATRKKREFNLDTSTFRGRINTLMSKLRDYYPTKQVIVMTPIHRAYANFGGNNIQYDELYENKGGYYLEEYICALKEAPDVWSCEIIDLHARSGLFPLNDTQAKTFFCSTERDRLHPNAEGHERIAQVMEAALVNIPLF